MLDDEREEVELELSVLVEEAVEDDVLWLEVDEETELLVETEDEDKERLDGLLWVDDEKDDRLSDDAESVLEDSEEEDSEIVEVLADDTDSDDREDEEDEVERLNVDDEELSSPLREEDVLNDTLDEEVAMLDDELTDAFDAVELLLSSAVV